jgi:hypothetical protein
MDSPVDPRLVAAACVPPSEESFDRHLAHSVDLLCLITGGKCWLERGPERLLLEPNTLILVRAGEGRLLRRRQRSNPALWLVYFQASGRFYEKLPVLGEPDPAKRIWKLAEPELDGFKDIFVKLTVERAGSRNDARQAESGWLSLLMVSLQRWKSPPNGHSEAPPLPSWEIPQPSGGSTDPKQGLFDSEVLRRRIKFLSGGT